MQRLTHIDLFSGIAGFALASSWAGFETVVFCEKDKYCHKILNKHWPDVPIIEDIHEFNGEQYCGATLLTGGVPCQPASTAGRQRGTADDRWLWPETLRVVREARPEWVILENVRGLISLNGGVEFDNLLTEVEAIGYETRAFVIPACSVNAPHRRERVWIVANARHQRFLQQRSIDSHEEQSNRQRRMGQDVLQEKPETKREVLANTTQRRSVTIQQKQSSFKCTSWRSAFSYLGQLDDGFPSRLVGPEPNIPRITNEKDRDRANKLRALGNAVVPQVAYQIIEKIAMIELGNCKRIFDSSTN